MNIRQGIIHRPDGTTVHCYAPGDGCLSYATAYKGEARPYDITDSEATAICPAGWTVYRDGPYHRARPAPAPTCPLSIARAATQAVPMNRYLAATFRTLDKHRASGAFDTHAALRLLRNNVRDIAPRNVPLTAQDRDDIARRLLRYYRLTRDGAAV